MRRLAPLGDPRCWDYPGYPNIKQLTLTEPALYWWRGTTPDWVEPAGVLGHHDGPTDCGTTPLHEAERVRS